jgi:cytochrome c oxidase subunit 3
MTPAERAHTWRLAVWILIASEALLFAGLFALYAGYRAEYADTFARAAGHDIAWMGGANTMILIASSFAMTWAVVQAREDRARDAMWSLVIVIVLGVVFAALKLTEWHVHIGDGIVAGAAYSGPDEGPGTRLFFTLYFLMTGLHLFHLVVGLALVVWMVVAARRAKLRVLPLELIALYWNFVDLVWMFLWPMFYLLRAR